MRPHRSSTGWEFVTAGQQESRQLEKKAFLWSLAIFILSNIFNYFLNPSNRNEFGLEKNGLIEVFVSLIFFQGAYLAIKVVSPKDVMQKINNTPSIWMKILLGSAVLVFVIYSARFLTGGL